MYKAKGRTCFQLLLNFSRLYVVALKLRGGISNLSSNFSLSDVLLIGSVSAIAAVLGWDHGFGLDSWTTDKFLDNLECASRRSRPSS
jgi:uncharacterized membrane protein